MRWECHSDSKAMKWQVMRHVTLIHSFCRRRKSFASLINCGVLSFQCVPWNAFTSQISVQRWISNFAAKEITVDVIHFDMKERACFLLHSRLPAQCHNLLLSLSSANKVSVLWLAELIIESDNAQKTIHYQLLHDNIDCYHLSLSIISFNKGHWRIYVASKSIGVEKRDENEKKINGH